MTSGAAATLAQILVGLLIAVLLELRLLSGRLGVRRGIPYTWTATREIDELERFPFIGMIMVYVLLPSVTLVMLALAPLTISVIEDRPVGQLGRTISIIAVGATLFAIFLGPYIPVVASLASWAAIFRARARRGYSRWLIPVGIMVAALLPLAIAICAIVWFAFSVV